MFDRTTWIAIILSVARPCRMAVLPHQDLRPLPRAAGRPSQGGENRSTGENHRRHTAPSATPSVGVLPAVTPFIPTLSSRKATLDTSRAEYLFVQRHRRASEGDPLLDLGANEQSLFLNADSGMPIGTSRRRLGILFDRVHDGGGPELELHPHLRRRPGASTPNSALPRRWPEPPEKDYLIGLTPPSATCGTSPLTLPGYYVAASRRAPVHTPRPADLYMLRLVP